LIEETAMIAVLWVIAFVLFLKWLDTFESI
jgi:hypothetical protein